MIVDKSQLANIFGISVDTIRTWVKDGCPVHQEPKRGKGLDPQERNKLFDTVAVHNWLLQRARRWY